MAQQKASRKKSQYRRLPGRGLRREGVAALFTRTWGTLWLAQDHILSVDTHLFSEEYKRFYFRDIQAIVLSKTRRGVVLNVITAVLTLLFLWPAFIVEHTVGIALWLLVSGIFAVVLGMNIWRGPTCTCYLVTAVHKEVLPSLNRIKTAEKVSKILRRHIEKAQRDLVVQEAGGRRQ